MKSIISFVGGIIVTLVVLVLVGYFSVKAGIVPANADSKPTDLERWAAKTALDAVLERDTNGHIGYSGFTGASSFFNGTTSAAPGSVPITNSGGKGPDPMIAP